MAYLRVTQFHCHQQLNVKSTLGANKEGGTPMSARSFKPLSANITENWLAGLSVSPRNFDVHLQLC